MKAFGVALAIVLMASPAATAPLPQSGTFIYSNACSSPGGDFSGYRVSLTRGQSTVRVVIDFNDSGPDGHATARILKFDSVSGKLSFSFQGNDLRYLFQGTVSQSDMRGTVDAMDDNRRLSVSIAHDDIKLPVLKRVPKRLPDCDPAHPA